MPYDYAALTESAQREAVFKRLREDAKRAHQRREDRLLSQAESDFHIHFFSSKLLASLQRGLLKATGYLKSFAKEQGEHDQALTMANVELDKPSLWKSLRNSIIATASGTIAGKLFGQAAGEALDHAPVTQFFPDFVNDTISDVAASLIGSATAAVVKALLPNGDELVKDAEKLEAFYKKLSSEQRQCLHVLVEQQLRFITYLDQCRYIDDIEVQRFLMGYREAVVALVHQFKTLHGSSLLEDVEAIFGFKPIQLNALKLEETMYQSFSKLCDSVRFESHDNPVSRGIAWFGDLISGNIVGAIVYLLGRFLDRIVDVLFGFSLVRRFSEHKRAVLGELTETFSKDAHVLEEARDMPLVDLADFNHDLAQTNLLKASQEGGILFKDEVDKSVFAGSPEAWFADYRCYYQESAQQEEAIQTLQDNVSTLVEHAAEQMQALADEPHKVLAVIAKTKAYIHQQHAKLPRIRYLAKVRAQVLELAMRLSEKEGAQAEIAALKAFYVGELNGQAHSFTQYATPGLNIKWRIGAQALFKSLTQAENKAHLLLGDALSWGSLGLRSTQSQSALVQRPLDPQNTAQILQQSMHYFYSLEDIEQRHLYSLLLVQQLCSIWRDTPYRQVRQQIAHTLTTFGIKHDIDIVRIANDAEGEGKFLAFRFLFLDTTIVLPKDGVLTFVDTVHGSYITLHHQGNWLAKGEEVLESDKSEPHPLAAFREPMSKYAEMLPPSILNAEIQAAHYQP